MRSVRKLGIRHEQRLWRRKKTRVWPSGIEPKHRWRKLCLSESRSLKEKVTTVEQQQAVIVAMQVNIATLKADREGIKTRLRNAEVGGK